MNNENHPLHPRLHTPIDNSSHDSVRKQGERGSDHNRMRGELYEDAWDRVKNAEKHGSLFEIITLCDMITTDRMEAFTQYLMHEDEKQFHTDSIGEAFKNFGWAVKNKGPCKGIRKDSELRELYILIQEFVGLRNRVVHGHLIVRNSTVDVTLDERKELLGQAAEKGKIVARLISNWTERHIVIS